MDPRRLLRALSFAADKHRNQRRKGVTAAPYINHPIAVAYVLSQHATDVDEETLLAAALHDTVEDTETTLEELEREFGGEVAALVAEVTDDKSLPKEVRKRLQIQHGPTLSPRAKRLKLADKISNVRDVANDPPNWPERRRREYLDWAEEVVSGLRGVDGQLDALFDETLAETRRVLGVG